MINRGIFHCHHFLMHSSYSINQVYGTESKICHMLYIDDMRLIRRSEEELEMKSKL